MKPEQLKHWRLAVFLWGASFFGASTTTAQATEVVRIGTINGYERVDQVIEVSPGEPIALTADIYRKYGTYFDPQFRPVEEFVWSANNRWSNECDAAWNVNCLDHSDFEVNDYGVTFYVPWSMNQDITIHVRSHQHWDTDTLILRNRYQNLSAPNVIVTHPTEYYQYYPHHQQILPDYYLAGQGRFVWINGKRFWVPYHYKKGWTPYQNGYWSWVGTYGWTWNSYDPWGSYTDHYGVWRFHATYGWIWAKFQGNNYRYHAHCVTFYYSGGFIGWYPFHSSYAYQHGYQHGFQDGFWAGLTWGLTANHLYGHTLVKNQYFGQRLMNAKIQKQQKALTRLKNAFAQKQIGNHPGAADLKGSYEWGKAQTTVHETEMDLAGRIQFARQQHETPKEYLAVKDQTAERFQKQIPVGSLVTASSSRSGEIQIIRPNQNNRGLSTTPIIVDRNGKAQRMKIRSQSPSRINPAHPGHSRRENAQRETAPEVPTTPPRTTPPRTTPPRTTPPRTTPPKRSTPTKRPGRGNSRN